MVRRDAPYIKEHTVKRSEEFNVGRSAWKFAVVAALTLMAANAFAGQITVYERSGFQGQSLTTTIALPDLERSPFNDVASSIVVTDGTWEACTEPYYRGRCAQLVPGTYRRLSGALSDVVMSVRQVGYDAEPARVVINPDSPPVAVNAAPTVVINPGAAPVVITPPSGSVVVTPGQAQVVAAPPVMSAVQVPLAGRVILYQHTGGGVVRAVELTSNADDLSARRFENSADAALVSGGIWRLCDGEGARGHCTDFSPGQYASLGALNGKVMSAYLIASGSDHVPVVAAVPAGRAVLYEYPNFGGGRLVVESGPAPDLDWARFKNPAASLRIESGSWLVCSDLGYQGECQVLDPGDYPVLTGSLGNGIASARQVWRPAYGSMGRVVAHDEQRDSHHPDLTRYVP
jgi:hypothetical protein